MVVGSQLPVLQLLNVLLTQVYGWQVLGVLCLCWEVVTLEDLGLIAAPPCSLRKLLFELHGLPRTRTLARTPYRFA